jgi:hypothetical protein
MEITKKNTNIPSMLTQFIFIVFIAFIASNSFGQDKIIVTATGSYEARDLTLDEVKKRAIEEAKLNAMVKAGISENVKVSDFLYTYEDEEKFRDIFQFFISTETGADIMVENVRELKRDINEFGNILIEVEIDAAIYKHNEEKDPTFKFVVNGIRDIYYENDPLDFSFEPSRDGYLKIFNVAADDAFMLFPYHDDGNSYLNDEDNRLFKKKIKVNFPVNKMIDGYYFQLEQKNQTSEFNLLIFVFTKEDYPFLGEVDVPNIMKWIFDIPLDRRDVQQWGIIVKK